jgi:hypothetical protein
MTSMGARSTIDTIHLSTITTQTVNKETSEGSLNSLDGSVDEEKVNKDDSSENSAFASNDHPSEDSQCEVSMQIY